MPDYARRAQGKRSKIPGADSHLGMHSLIQDVQFSLRLMRTHPLTTFLVLAALTFGMSLNVAIFSVLNAVLLRPLPISEPDRLVWLRGKNISTGTLLATSYPDFLDWRAQSQSFDGMAADRKSVV